MSHDTRRPPRNYPARIQRLLLVVLVFAGTGLNVGCRSTGCSGDQCTLKGGHSSACRINNCANIPPGALPAPLGLHVRSFQHAQTTKARGDLFVLYEKEWVPGRHDPAEFTTELGPEGVRHLKRLIDALPTVEGPIVVEPTANRKLSNEERRELDERRYEQIVNQLYLEGVEQPESRVVLAYSRAEGLFGDESPRAYARTIIPGINNSGMGGGQGAGMGMGGMGMGGMGMGGMGMGGMGGLGIFGGMGGFG